MMRSMTILFLTLFIVGLTAQGVQAQGNSSQDAAPEKKAKLSDEDLAFFEPLLTSYMDTTRGTPEEEAAMEALLKAMEEYSERNKVSTPVADDQAWGRLFKRYIDAAYRKKKSSGAGRVKTETYILPRKGEYYGFEYSVLVPKSYDASRSWPLLISLHDAGAKDLGKGYIKKVWQGTKESKALCENFIILAPHLPDRLASRKVKLKKNGKTRRITTSTARVKWFNTYQLLSVFMPLIEVRRNFNVDPTRIFVEGVGEGADLAVTLAAVSSGKFAGLISRHGRLHDEELVVGLQHTPSLFFVREDGAFAKSSKGRKFIELLDSLKNGDTSYDSLIVEKLPPAGKKKLPSKLMANQNTDPMLEVNARVAAFMKEHTLSLTPKEIRITSNHVAFRSHAFLKVTAHDIAAGQLLDCIARFDREKNTVELTGKNFFGVSLFLNDSVLDLSRPVQVLVNGKVVEARVPDRSPSRMLSWFHKTPTDYHLVRTSLLVVPRFTLDEEKKEGEEEKASKTVKDTALESGLK